MEEIFTEILTKFLFHKLAPSRLLLLGKRVFYNNAPFAFCEIFFFIWK